MKIPFRLEPAVSYFNISQPPFNKTQPIRPSHHYNPSAGLSPIKPWYLNEWVVIRSTIWSRETDHRAFISAPWSCLLHFLFNLLSWLLSPYPNQPASHSRNYTSVAVVAAARFTSSRVSTSSTFEQTARLSPSTLRSAAGLN